MTKDIRKILIIELWAIGDVVMMSPILKPLRTEFPQAQITVLCQDHGREILEQNKEISSFVTFKFPWTAFQGKYRFWNWNWKSIFSTIAQLRREKFDLILDGRGDIRDDFLTFLIGARQYISAPHKRVDHRVDCWASLLKNAGVAAPVLRANIAVSAEERTTAQLYVKKSFPIRPRQLIGIHPGASQSVKRWPLSRFKELVQRLMKVDHVGVIIFSDQQGHGYELGKGLNVPVFTGNIRELTAVLTQLDLFICNDTGVMHIASALDIPVVAIFGPGDPNIFSPRGTTKIVIKDCKGRPCFGYCGKKTADCLLAIDVEDVWSAIPKKIFSIASNSDI